MQENSLPPRLVHETPAGHLANELEGTSGKALRWLDAILSQPIDTECAPLLRAQAAAAMTTLNTQLRADALRLRAQRADQALERLIEAIRQQEPLVPMSEGRSGSSRLLGDGATV